MNLGWLVNTARRLVIIDTFRMIKTSTVRNLGFIYIFISPATLTKYNWPFEEECG